MNGTDTRNCWPSPLRHRGCRVAKEPTGWNRRPASGSSPPERIEGGLKVHAKWPWISQICLNAPFWSKSTSGCPGLDYQDKISMLILVKKLIVQYINLKFCLFTNNKLIKQTRTDRGTLGKELTTSQSSVDTAYQTNCVLLGTPWCSGSTGSCWSSPRWWCRASSCGPSHSKGPELPCNDWYERRHLISRGCSCRATPILVQILLHIVQ